MIEKEVQDKKLFDKISMKYAKKDIVTYCKLARKLRLFTTLKNVPKPIERLLEIGCGAGFSAKYLESYYNQFIGIDYSTNLINFANKYNSHSSARFIEQNFKDYKSNQKYKVILMIGVLHHMTEIEKILKQLKNLLAEGGRIVINEPQKGNVFIGILRKIRKVIDTNYSEKQVEFSKSDLVKLFENNGFQVNTFPQGVFSTPFAEIASLPKWFAIPLSLLACLIDPVLEKLLAIFSLDVLSWNIVLEAKIKE